MKFAGVQKLESKRKSRNIMDEFAEHKDSKHIKLITAAQTSSKVTCQWAFDLYTGRGEVNTTFSRGRLPYASNFQPKEMSHENWHMYVQIKRSKS